MMTRQLDLIPRLAEPVPAPLVAVDRATAELRRGGMVAVTTGSETILVLAAEGVTAESVGLLGARAGTAPTLAVSGRRAVALGLRDEANLPAVALISAPGGLVPADIAAIADPCDRGPRRAVRSGLEVKDAAESTSAAAAVALAKVARLLPAAVIAGVKSLSDDDTPSVSVADIFAYQHNAARALRIVSEARVPLKDAENARIVAFRPADGGIEHLAIVIGEPDADQPVLARLHSECFTGDLLGSLRCDCGDQLRGAIAEIAQAGSGIVLYLSQEGRGIGLVNKLRAYQLQDAGFDTLDANLQLGFDDDERIYQPAAQMLRLLGVGRVRLMTNNPGKVDSLARHGIDVAERIPHVFPANDHNEFYLRTKSVRGGHLF